MAAIDEYIKKYCVKHGIDEETAKTHAAVKAVSDYYATLEKEKRKDKAK